MSPPRGHQVATLERAMATLHKRAQELPVPERNEAQRKIDLFDDETARILAPNAV